MFFSCRDIPMPLVSSGVEHGNLRELAFARMKDLGIQVRGMGCQTITASQANAVGQSSYRLLLPAG